MAKRRKAKKRSSTRRKKNPSKALASALKKLELAQLGVAKALQKPAVGADARTARRARRARRHSRMMSALMKRNADKTRKQRERIIAGDSPVPSLWFT